MWCFCNALATGRAAYFAFRDWSRIWCIVPGMRLWAIFLFIVFLAEPAVADCAAEPSVRARAHCLRAQVETARAALAGEIATATADLTASGRVLRDFESALTQEQTRWRLAVDAGCKSVGDAVEVELCRLSETRQRRVLVRGELDRARSRLGLPPLVRVPAEVEVLLPLPAPPAGPDADADVRVPLAVPVDGG